MTARRCTLVLALLFAGDLRADWPHVRGPAYSGVSDEVGLAESWPAVGPPRLWQRTLGQGHSGMVVGDGRLFTQRQSAAGQYLVCLDAISGDLLWETRYARPWQLHGAYPGPYATPTFAGGKVYFASPTSVVGCVDAATGAILWTVDLEERFAGRGYGFGFAATPLVEEGRVIFPVGGAKASMVALDAADDRTVWAVGSDPASYCPALPIEFRGRRFVVGYLENSVVLVDAAQGAIVHRQRLSTGYDEHSAWPLYREPHLLLTAPFRAPAAQNQLYEDAKGTLDWKTVWSSKRLSNDVASSVLYGDAVYGFDLKQLQSSAHRPSRGVFSCLDWTTGSLRWTANDVGQATILAADGKLFLLDDAGRLILARADPSKYVELGRVQLFEDEICWTPPALWRGRLFVRSPSRLICLDVRRPDLRTPSEIAPAAHVAPRSWRVDPSWLMTREREYPNDAPTPAEARLWFSACLLMLGAAGLVSAACRRPHVWPLFLAIAFCLGLLGPNVLSGTTNRCLFTWPLCVFVALHGATRASLANDIGPWRARLWIAALVLVCGGYFAACRAVGMPVGWYFLFGLPLGVPFSAWAVRAERAARSAAAGMLTLLSFTAFYWGGYALLLWRSGAFG